MKRWKGADTPRGPADDGCKLWLFNMREGGQAATRMDSRGVKFELAKLKVPYSLITIAIIIILDGAMSRIDDEAEFSSRASEARLTYNKVHKCARVRERERCPKHSRNLGSKRAERSVCLSLSLSS